MAKPKEKPDPRWVRVASRALDEMECNPPSEESLAPWRTDSWRRKGEGMLQGLKPIAVILLLALGGCAKGWLEDWAPSGGAHSTTYIDGRAITTYHYPAPDPLGSVHEFRPDIYHRFYGPH